MHIFKFITVSSLSLLMMQLVCAQPNPNVVYDNNIHSVQLYAYGDQESMAIYKLNSSDRVELHFDDMETITELLNQLNK